MIGKPQVYRYVVDMLSDESAEAISKSLRAVPDVLGVAVHPRRGLVEIKARRNLEEQVRMACGIARVTYRTRM